MSANSKTKLIRTCSIWRALEVIGDKPTLLLLESYWLGTRQFSDFCKQTGLLKTVVSNRLQKLVSEQCFTKELYSEKPRRYQYKATQRLLTMYPVAMAMLSWEKKWSPQRGKLAIELTHTHCNHSTVPVPVCEHCRQPVNARDVDWQEGPGLGQMKASYSRRRKSRKANTGDGTQLFDAIAEIIGDRWSMLIIRSLFTGLNGFNDIQADSQIATNILAERLEYLAAQKIIKRSQRADSQRHQYQLLERGMDIYPILLNLMAWGDKWFADQNGPPVILKHNSCGHELVLSMACSNCDKNLNYQEVSFKV